MYIDKMVMKGERKSDRQTERHTKTDRDRMNEW